MEFTGQARRKQRGFSLNGSKNFLVSTGAIGPFTLTLAEAVGEDSDIGGSDAERNDNTQQQSEPRAETPGVHPARLHQQLHSKARLDQQAE